jgi:hypothetical protein
LTWKLVLVLGLGAAITVAAIVAIMQSNDGRSAVQGPVAIENTTAFHDAYAEMQFQEHNVAPASGDIVQLSSRAATMKFLEEDVVATASVSAAATDYETIAFREEILSLSNDRSLPGAGDVEQQHLGEVNY